MPFPRLLGATAVLVTSVYVTPFPEWLQKLQECFAETAVSLTAAPAIFLLLLEQ